MNKDNSKSITLKEAIKWMSWLAASDGAITPNELKVMKLFSEVYGVDLNDLVKSSYEKTQNVIAEVEYYTENEMKGRKFEDFVVSFLTDKSVFRLISWRSDKIVNGIYAEENLLPDLCIRQTIGEVEVEYFIECKYRSTWNIEGKIDLSKQFSRYYNYAINNHKELFYALGVGGTPSKPDLFYLIPMRMFKQHKEVPRDFFKPCICEPTKEAFKEYVSHYFTKRVLKKRDF